MLNYPTAHGPSTKGLRKIIFALKIHVLIPYSVSEKTLLFWIFIFLLSVDQLFYVHFQSFILSLLNADKRRSHYRGFSGDLFLAAWSIRSTDTNEVV